MNGSSSLLVQANYLNFLSFSMLGQGLRYFWAWFVFMRQTVPIVYVL